MSSSSGPYSHLGHQLQAALAHHQAGRMPQAEAGYRQVLAQAPHHPDALHLLGVLYYQIKRYVPAEELIRRAIAIQPNVPFYHYNLGETLRAASHPAEAAACHRRAIALQPNNPEAYTNLGLSLRAMGDLDGAIAALRQAVALHPGLFEAQLNLGQALAIARQIPQAMTHFEAAAKITPPSADQGWALAMAWRQVDRPEDALMACDQALARNPQHADAWNSRGAALHDLKRAEESIAAHRQAIALRENFPQAHYNLGNALLLAGRTDEAIESFQKAIALKPEYANAYNNLGNAFKEKGLHEQAIAAYGAAISLQPDFSRAYSNLGTVLHLEARLEEAMAAYARALEIDPRNPDAAQNQSIQLFASGNLTAAANALDQLLQAEPARTEAFWNRAHLKLLMGEYVEGWAEYECRWQSGLAKGDVHAALEGKPPAHAISLRDPEPPTLLVCAEQGVGDTLQFIRYLQVIAARGSKLIFECQPAIKQLLLHADLPAQIVARHEPIPPFDARVALLSLPHLLGTTLDNIPNQIPYLRAEPARAGRWAERLAFVGGQEKTLKVGLVWAGNPEHKNDRNRSIPLAAFAPLFAIPGVTILSLQKGIAGQHIISTGLPLLDFTDELTDYIDTAALIAGLDLVISVDTSVAHLAGALGRPVWTLVTFIPDFRWLLQRDDSPWYPTMRLFRQSVAGDWSDPIARAAAALTALAAQR